MKQCEVCLKVKPLDKFQRITDNTYRKTCKACRSKEGYDSRKAKEVSLRQNYKIDLGMYNELLEAQGFKCAICDRSRAEFNKDFAVDHCHTTGKIRGLLCTKCNTGLGLFKDSTILLDKAKDYLTKPVFEFTDKVNDSFERGCSILKDEHDISVNEGLVINTKYKYLLSKVKTEGYENFIHFIIRNCEEDLSLAYNRIKFIKESA